MATHVTVGKARHAGGEKNNNKKGLGIRGWGILKTRVVRLERTLS